MISQASSEQTVTMVVPTEDARRMERMLRDRFAPELASGTIERIVCKDGVAVASIIGQGMAGTPGVSGKLFSVLASVGVNVRAIAQGGSELSISLAIEETAVERAVRAVHTSFGLTRVCNILLVGCGRVGQTVLRLMQETREALLKDLDLDLRLVGVVNRSKLLFDAQGLSLDDVPKRLAEASARPDDAGLIQRLVEAHFTDVIVVDVSAADTVDLHQRVLEAGFNVVTANKVPISGSLARYTTLKDTLREKGGRYGYETTFGAGLPVLHSLKELVNTGDKLLSISGCLSGTLGFICTRLQEGASVKEAVKEAEEAGFTEPDPREDLSGRDVARKALIIARAAGMALEPDDVELEPMVPGMDKGLVVALDAYASELAQRVAAAKAEGKVLRYMADIRDEAVRVGMQAVAADSPVGSLSGPDNILVFRTKRYEQFPLVVRGPGAGAEVTAAGVLGDMLKVARGQ
jgi:aspartokinase/homoserine dehydrogenase 1